MQAFSSMTWLLGWVVWTLARPAFAPEVQLDLDRVYHSDAIERFTRWSKRDRAQIGWPAHPAACGRGRRVGIVDSGFDITHSELSGASIKLESRSDAGSAHLLRHGTGVASLLVGRSSGLLPGAQLYAVPAFWEENGHIVSNAERIIQGITWLVEQRVEVINLSLSGPADALMTAAIQAAQARGIAVVAAAGNGGPEHSVSFPANLPGVVTATAVDEQGRAYRAAARGPEIDFAAPGVDVVVADTLQPDGLSPQSGTSYAAPFVTAALALSPRGVQDLIDAARDLGYPGRDPIFGWGLVRAEGLCREAAAEPRDDLAPRAFDAQSG